MNHWIWEHCISIIGHFSNIPLQVIGVVVDMLCATIWQSNCVRAMSLPSSITFLTHIKIGAVFSIVDRVLICVGDNLIMVDLDRMVNYRGFHYMGLHYRG